MELTHFIPSIARQFPIAAARSNFMTRPRIMMTFACLALALGVTASRADEASDELAKALRQAGDWTSYGFTTDEQPGAGTGGAVKVKYQEGQPLWCQAD